MDFFKSCGCSIFEVPGFTKLACVRLKLPAAQSFSPRVSRYLLRAALANLRSRNLLASIPAIGRPEAIFIFDNAPDNLRRILQPLETTGSARLIDLGSGSQLEYAAFDVLDFASPDFRNSLQAGSGVDEYLPVLLAFLGAVEERVRGRLATSARLIRLSTAAFQSKNANACHFSIHAAFSASAAVQIKVNPGQGPVLLPVTPDDQPGTNVYLAPCGIRASFLRMLSLHSSPPSNVPAQLVVIQEWLSIRGYPREVIDVSAPVVVVEFNLQSPLSQSDSDLVDSQCVLYWPASLCFKEPRIISPSDISHEGEVRRLLSGDYSDPLLFANAWRAQKSERAAQLAALPSSPGNSAEDRLSPLTGPKDAVDPQVSGVVYPTPSDGPATQNTPGSLSVDGVPLAELDAQDKTAMDVDNPQHEQPTTLDPAASTDMKPDHAEAHITEDDFDFFNDHRSPGPYESNRSDSVEQSPQENVERKVVFVRATPSPPPLGAQPVKPSNVLPDSTPSSLTPEAIKLRLNPSSAHPDASSSKNSKPSSHKHLSNAHTEFASLLNKERNPRAPNSPINRSGQPSRKNSDTSTSGESSSMSGTDESESSSVNSWAGSKRPPAALSAHSPNTADNIFRHVLPPNLGQNLEVKPVDDTPVLEDRAALHNLLESCFLVASLDTVASTATSPHQGFSFSPQFDGFTAGEKIAAIQHVCKQVHAYHVKPKQKTPLSADVNSLLSSEIGSAFPKARQKHPFSLVMGADKDGVDRSSAAALDDRKMLVALRERFVELPTPYIRVQKSNAAWEMLPSALQFWETLGLAPANGLKFIRAFVVCPGGGGLKPAAERFLKQISSAYRSSRLGTVQNGWPDEPDTAVYPSPEEYTADDPYQSIGEICKHLGQELGQRGVTERRVVIFLVDPHDSASSLLRSSACFQGLLSAHAKIVDKAKPRPRPDVQLHVLPMSTMAKADAMRILSQDEATVLAHQVYDKFAPLGLSPKRMDLPIRAATSVELAKALPKNVPFELASRPPEHLLLQDSVMHVSYAMDAARAWLAAAWTDEAGRCSFTSCYHLAGRSFAEIALEVWQTTLEAVAPCRVRWRVLVASAGPCAPADRDAWLAVFRKHAAPDTSASLLAFCAAPDFAISPDLLPPPASAPSSASASGSASPAPAAAPDSSDSSAEPADDSPAPAATATAAGEPSESDPAARLVSPLDTAWCLMLASPTLRLATTPAHATPRPPLASALLLKRASTAARAAPAFAQVDLLAAGDGRRPEELLRDAVGQYRGLALLARVRGVGGEADVAPWHVAVAERAVALLAEGAAL